MKKLAVTLLLATSIANAAQAGMTVIGKGDDMRLDATLFPPEMKANYEIFRVRCAECHTLERTIVAIQTGVMPASGKPFNKASIKGYMVKMLRSSDLTKAEVKSSLDLMNYLITENDR
jgi:hypothetical protein